MPFQPGVSGNPAGRPSKDNSLRALLRRAPIRDKRELIKKAYEQALDGDSRWAEWIAKHSGEGAGEKLEITGDLNIEWLAMQRELKSAIEADAE